MKVSIQKLPKSQIELTVEIPSADFDKYLEKAIENLSKNLEIKGFRKGQVSKEIARDYLAEKDILEEAANLAVRETYSQAVKDCKIETIDSPKIEIIKAPAPYRAEGSGAGAPANSFIYRARVSVLPEIKLPDYKKISQKINEKNKSSFAKNSKVEEKEIDEAVLWLKRSRAKYIIVSREARVGDYVKIKLAPYRAEGSGAGSKIQNPPQESLRDPTGQATSNINKEEHEGIIGSGYFLPDFEKNLIGMKAGDKKTFSTEIPLTHVNKELAGKNLDFEVSLNLVQEVHLPEENDEFAKSLAPLDSKYPTGQGNFENLNSLRQSIRDSLKIEKEEKEKQKNRQELIQTIAKESQMEVPDILIEQKLEQEISRLKHHIEDSGLNFQDYLKNLKKTEDDLKRDWRGPAENQLNFALTLRQIAKNEKIAATQEEINEKVNEYLQKSQNIDIPDIDPVRSPFRERNGSRLRRLTSNGVDPEQLKLYYEDVIRNEKVFQLLEKL